MRHSLLNICVLNIHPLLSDEEQYMEMQSAMCLWYHFFFYFELPAMWSFCYVSFCLCVLQKIVFYQASEA